MTNRLYDSSGSMTIIQRSYKPLSTGSRKCDKCLQYFDTPIIWKNGEYTSLCPICQKILEEKGNSNEQSTTYHL